MRDTSSRHEHRPVGTRRVGLFLLFLLLLLLQTRDMVVVVVTTTMEKRANAVMGKLTAAMGSGLYVRTCRCCVR